MLCMWQNIEFIFISGNKIVQIEYGLFAWLINSILRKIFMLKFIFTKCSKTDHLYNSKENRKSF